MSNINVKNCSSSLEFLGDYEIESVEMNGDELNGESLMRLLIDDEEYEIAADAFDEWMDEQEFEELPDME